MVEGVLEGSASEGEKLRISGRDPASFGLGYGAFRCRVAAGGWGRRPDCAFALSAIRQIEKTPKV